MKRSKFKIMFALLGLALTGCLVSATFVIVESFTFTAKDGFYFYQVDITQEGDWKNHKDKIDNIDAVGVEFYVSSSEPSSVTFDAYIDDYSGLTANPTSVPGTATKIIDQLTIPPGLNQHLTYAQSLGFLTGTARLKALAKTGKFDYYGKSTGNNGTTFTIDSAKVIVTFSAAN